MLSENIDRIRGRAKRLSKIVGTCTLVFVLCDYYFINSVEKVSVVYLQVILGSVLTVGLLAGVTGASYCISVLLSHAREDGDSIE